MVLGWLRQKAHGWKYATLAGAMSVFGGSCKEDTQITDSPKELILAQETKILPESQYDLVRGFENDELFIDVDSSYAKNLKADDIIVAGSVPTAPHGLLQRVRSIKRSGSVFRIQTEQATLEEAIQEGTLEGSVDLTDYYDLTENKRSPLTIGPGTEQQQFPLKIELDREGRIIYDFENKEVAPGVFLDGQLSVSAGMHFEAEIDNFRLEYAVLNGEFREELDLRVGAEFDTGVHGTFPPEELPALELLELPTKTISVYGFPVTITPRFTLRLGIDGTGQLSAEAGLEQSLSAEYSLDYTRRKEGWQTSKEVTPRFEATPPSFDAAVRAELEAWAQVDFVFDLYRTGGLFVGIKGILGAEAEKQLGNDASYSIYTKLVAGTGAKAEIWGRTIVDTGLIPLYESERKVLLSSGDDGVPVRPSEGVQEPCGVYNFRGIIENLSEDCDNRSVIGLEENDVYFSLITENGRIRGQVADGDRYLPITGTTNGSRVEFSSEAERVQLRQNRDCSVLLRTQFSGTYTGNSLNGALSASASQPQGSECSNLANLICESTARGSAERTENLPECSGSDEGEEEPDGSEGEGPVAPTCEDADHDGYGVNCDRGPDCDDTNRDIHPGAREVCDGIDANCDGDVDSGVCQDILYVSKPRRGEGIIEIVTANSGTGQVLDRLSLAEHEEYSIIGRKSPTRNELLLASRQSVRIISLEDVSVVKDLSLEDAFRVPEDWRIIRDMEWLPDGNTIALFVFLPLPALTFLDRNTGEIRVTDYQSQFDRGQLYSLCWIEGTSDLAFLNGRGQLVAVDYRTGDARTVYEIPEQLHPNHFLKSMACPTQNNPYALSLADGLYRFEPQGSVLTRIYEREGLIIPSWVPDNENEIAVSDTVGDSLEILIRDARTGELRRQLTDTPDRRELLLGFTQ